MIIVFLALLMGLGVMFGIQALVVDLGYDMGQHGSMQNAADAAALAAARLLAYSVASSNPVTFAVTDNQVHSAADEFAAANRVASHPGASYQTAVEYLPWNGTTCVSRNADGTLYVQGTYTASSDPGLVTELGGTRNTAPADALGSVPSNTCGVRVFARVTYPAMFARVTPNNRSVERGTALATARVFATNPPTTVTNVWPITRWLGAPGCTFTVNSPPCTFWDSRGPPNGNFKLMLDMSRYSDLVYPNPLRPQHIDDWDHTFPGNSARRQTDLTNWLTFGWHGQLNVSDPRCAVQPGEPKILQFANCTNSRLEVYGGALGFNIGGAMQTFINAHAEGVDTSNKKLGKFVTMHVFLWRYGESNINTTTDVATTLWISGNSSSIQRVILEQIRCFRFYTGTVSNSLASGYYVSCLSTAPPIPGPPSIISNTVSLID